MSEVTTDNVESKNAGGLVEVVIKVSRTAKVVKGGRVMGFRALVVVGNREGSFGVAIGNGREVQIAIRKAIDAATKNMIRIDLNQAFSINYPVKCAQGATTVIMQPAAEGTGVIAGGAMRAIFDVAGVQNILAKCIGSTNPINVVLATVKGLKSIPTAAQIAAKRGKKLRAKEKVAENE